MAVLYMCGGLPAAGKTHYINSILEDDSQILIEKNKIRYSLIPQGQPLYSKEILVNTTFIEKITEFLLEGYDVFAEDLFLEPNTRLKFLKLIPTVYDEIHMIWFNTDKSTCIAQNELRKNTREYFSEKDLKRIAYDVVLPTEQEGYDNINIVLPPNAFMR